MHILPVHNRCALDFVIDGICEKCTASQADSKAAAIAPVADADSDMPLYTMRGPGDRLRARLANRSDQGTAVTVIDFTAFIGRLATTSGETILPFFRTSLSIDNKSTGHDFDPVTEADRAAEAVMRRLIKANFPQHGIVGEEFGNEREDAEYVWVLDPIDGTKSFISGFPIWGTLIALLHRGTPVFGMMHQPYIGERFSRRQRLGAVSWADRRAKTGGAALRLAEGSHLVHHQSAVDEFRRPRRVQPRRSRGAADALRRRLLFLLHARRRPSRSRRRDRAETLRYRGADSDRHRRRRRGHHLGRQARAKRRPHHRRRRSARA